MQQALDMKAEHRRWMEEIELGAAAVTEGPLDYGIDESSFDQRYEHVYQVPYVPTKIPFNWVPVLQGVVYGTIVGVGVAACIYAVWRNV